MHSEQVTSDIYTFVLVIGFDNKITYDICHTLNNLNIGGEKHNQLYQIREWKIMKLILNVEISIHDSCYRECQEHYDAFLNSFPGLWIRFDCIHIICIVWKCKFTEYIADIYIDIYIDILQNNAEHICYVEAFSHTTLCTERVRTSVCVSGFFCALALWGQGCASGFFCTLSFLPCALVFCPIVSQN